MQDYFLVRVDSDTLLNMFCERVKFWRRNRYKDDYTEAKKQADKEDLNLYCDMYKQAIENGLFDCAEIDVADIVDKDIINYTGTLRESDLSDYDLTKEDFKELVKLYEQGERDVSCLHYGFSFIEACDKENKILLIRF